MDARKKLRLPTMTVVSSLGLSILLAGCGQSDSTTGSNSGPASGTASTAALPETVDLNSSTELASALDTMGVETPPTAPIGTDRASGAEGLVFPTWPAGEVRKGGLTTYRIDASASYDNDGVLKFMEGSKVLFEAPFAPESVKTVGTIPASVLAAAKVGDTITWGVYFANKKQKAVTASFSVIDKPAAVKSLAKLDADKGTTRVLRDIAKAQALRNYGFHSEALTTYVGIAEEDKRIVAVLTPILDCLRAMKMKNTPLFDDVKVRAVGITSPAPHRVGPRRRRPDGPGQPG